MYIISLERIPLPKFSTYVFLSIFSFVTSITYLILDYINTYNPFQLNSNTTLCIISEFSDHLQNIIENFMYDSWCFWSFINLMYCGLLMLGRIFQNIFFGELREEEQSHILEKFWNFVFYKLVFIYGILNVQTLHELLLWTGWSSILGFLHLLTNLAKERFEFIIQSSKVSTKSHMKIVMLLLIILTIGNILIYFSIIVGIKYSYHIMFFMLAEVFQLSGITLYVLLNYGILYVDESKSVTLISKDQNKIASILQNQIWYRTFNKLIVQYYAELYYVIFAHLIDCLHNLHMLFWNNIKINMTGLVIGMHLQYLYYDMSKRFQRHIKYLKIVKYIDNHFILVNKLFDKCAICWEPLSLCRKLTCAHYFHDGCLRSWLESSSLCPSCQNVVVINENKRKYDQKIDKKSSNTEKVENQNSSVVNGKINYIHSIYPDIPIDIIYEKLKYLNGDIDILIEEIQKGRIRRIRPTLFTGPMQVELDMDQNDEFLNYVGTTNRKCNNNNTCLPMELYMKTKNDSENIDNSSYRQKLFISRKKDIIAKAREKYKKY